MVFLVVRLYCRSVSPPKATSCMHSGPFLSCVPCVARKESLPHSLHGTARLIAVEDGWETWHGRRSVGPRLPAQQCNGGTALVLHLHTIYTSRLRRSPLGSEISAKQHAACACES